MFELIKRTEENIHLTSLYRQSYSIVPQPVRMNEPLSYNTKQFIGMTKVEAAVTQALVIFHNCYLFRMHDIEARFRHSCIRKFHGRFST